MISDFSNQVIINTQANNITDMGIMWQKWYSHASDTLAVNSGSVDILVARLGNELKKECVQNSGSCCSNTSCEWSVKSLSAPLRLKRIPSAGYFRKLRKTVINALSSTSANSSFSFSTISITHDRDVQLGKLMDVPVLVVKRYETGESILIARELDQLCQNKGVSFVPAFYGYCDDPDISIAQNDEMMYKSYVEYIPGVSLMEAIQGGQFKESDLHGCLAVYHTTLDWLWHAIGFVHADLTPYNMMLRHYGEGRTFEVPILDREGNITGVAELPFYPVLIDFGFSVTKNHSRWQASTSPHMSPLCDILRMYYFLNANFSDAQIAKVIAMLDQYFLFKPGNFITPLSVSIPGLSHKKLANLYMKLANSHSK
jgi:serine/threonine protein kinase